jgi:hypothetical protein
MDPGVSYRPWKVAPICHLPQNLPAGMDTAYGRASSLPGEPGCHCLVTGLHLDHGLLSPVCRFVAVVVAVLINSPACPVLFVSGVECGGDCKTACGSVRWIVGLFGSSGFVPRAIKGSDKSRRVRMTCKEQNLPISYCVCTMYSTSTDYMDARLGRSSFQQVLLPAPFPRLLPSFRQTPP